MKERAPLLVLVGAAAAFVGALVVFGSGSEAVPDTTTSTFADIAIPDPPLPGTTVPRAIEVTPTVDTIRGGLDGRMPLGLERLVVVVGSDVAGHRLIVVDPGDGAPAAVRLPADASDFGVDSSGSVLSFVDGASDLQMIGLDGGPIATPGGITRFVWSGDEPLTGAWSFEDGSVVVGRVEDEALVVTDSLGSKDDDERIEGMTSDGWWVTSIDAAAPRTTLVEFVPRSDVSGWILPADVVVTPASGSRALVGRFDVTSWRWSFGLAGADLRPLEWAPGDASGTARFAAMSPTGLQFAFIGRTDRGAGWLEVHSVVGGTAPRLLLSHPPDGVGWSQRGDYVLVTASDDAGRSTLMLLDARIGSSTEPTLTAIQLDEAIRFVAVVDAPRHTVSDSGPDGA